MSLSARMAREDALTEALRVEAFKLSCDDQFLLARQIASNVGYDLITCRDVDEELEPSGIPELRTLARMNGYDVVRAEPAALAAQPEESAQPTDGWVTVPQEARRWRHKKRGSTYTEIGRGKVQTENWEERVACPRVQGDGTRSVDMSEVIIYRADEDGSLWVRPVEEFEDGRFEALPTPPKSEKEEG